MTTTLQAYLTRHEFIKLLPTAQVFPTTHKNRTDAHNCADIVYVCMSVKQDFLKLLFVVKDTKQQII